MYGRAFLRRIYHKVFPLLPPALDETLQMWRALGYFPNVWRPRTFNEKVAHRKLFVRDPRFALLADKWHVRHYVRDRVGEEYLIPTYCCSDDPYTISTADLPKAFVVKATHDCGSTIVVRNKDECDWDALIVHLSETLRRPYGVYGHEWFYQEIPPRVLVEELLLDSRFGLPIDFKFYVFHGIVKYVHVMHDRFIELADRFYDRDWQPLNVRKTECVAPVIPRPKHLEQMVWVAETLAEGFDFVRVDLYSPDDRRVLFGEMTFTPGSGRGRFIPSSFDWELGRLW